MDLHYTCNQKYLIKQYIHFIELKLISSNSSKEGGKNPCLIYYRMNNSMDKYQQFYNSLAVLKSQGS